MKKTLYSILAILFFLTAALMIAPHFINWNQYKPIIQEKAQAYLGRTLAIDGDIKLTLLPHPAILIYDIRLSNASGAHAPDMIKIREISASIALLPLLKKEIVINRLEFVKPEIELEKFAGGKTNWDFVTRLSEKESAVNSTDREKSGPQSSIQLKSVEITHAQLTYREGSSVTQIQGFNTQVEAQSLQGPFKLVGSLIYKQLPLSFKAQIGDLHDLSALKIHADIEQGLHKADFEGTVNVDKMQAQGQIRSLVDGKALMPFESPFSQTIPVESKIEADARHISLTDLMITLADVKAIGSADLSLEGSQAYQVQLKGLPGTTSIQATGTLAHMAPFEGFVKVICENFKPLLAWAKVDTHSLPPSLHGKVSLETALSASPEEIQVSDLVLTLGESRVSGKAAWKGKTLTVDLQTPNAKPWLLLAGVKNAYDVGALALKANAQGDLNLLKLDSHLKLAGGTLDLKGALSHLNDDISYNMDINLTHPNFNVLAQAFAMDAAQVALGGGRIESHVEGTARKINLTQLKGNLSGGAVTIAGHADIDFSGKKPRVKAALTLGHIVLDNLLAQSSRDTGKKESKTKHTAGAKHSKAISSSTSKWSQDPIDFSGLQAADVSLKIDAASLKYKVYHIAPFALEAELANGTLTIPAMTGGLFGGQFKGSSSLSNPNAPSLKVTMALKNASLQSLLGPGSPLNIKGGKIDMDLNLVTQGKSVFTLVTQLGGHLSLLAQNGVFEGFDLHALAKNLKSAGTIEGLANLLGSSMASGQTAFERFSANFDIKNGVAHTNDIALVSTAATANGKGFIDLPKWFMDITADIKLVDFPQLPPFKFSLRGPLDAPQHDVDKGNLGVEFFKQFGANTVGKILKKATGLSIPGLSGDEEPADGGDSPKQKDKPQSDIKPEKVLKNVLEGLFK